MEENHLNFDELVTAKDDDRSNKSPAKFIALAVALVLLIGIGIGGWKYKQFCDDVSYAVTKLSETSLSSFRGEDELWYDEYLAVKDSTRFEKKLIEAMGEMVAPSEEGKSPNYEYLCRTLALLDTMQWHNENAKAFALEALSDAKQTYLKDENYGLTTLLRVLSMLNEATYYPGGEDVLTKEDLQNYTAAAKEEMLLSRDYDALEDYVQKISKIVEECSFVDTEDFVSSEEIMAIVTRGTEAAFYENDKGGYYDGQHKNGSSTKDSLEATIRHSYTYYGDFMISYYSKTAYRPTGEAWENELLSKYDSSSTTLYYKGEEISCSIDALRKVLGGGSLITRKQSEAPAGEQAAMSLEQFYNSGEAEVLGVLVNAEENFICVIKDDGIAFPTWSLELPFERISADGYELTPEAPDAITVNRLAMDVTDENLDTAKDYFADSDYQLIGFDRENNRLVIILPVPEGTEAQLENKETFDAFEQDAYAVYLGVFSKYEDTDMDIMLIFVSDTDSNAVLFANLNGEEVDVIFDETTGTEEPADA